MNARSLIALGLMTKVIFLCPHGAAKSLIAATLFNELAAGRGLLVSASAAATEEPYAEVPPRVVEVLGEDVRAFQPRRVAAADLDAASRVITIDCDPKTVPATRTPIVTWNDVPKLSEGFDGSRAAIRKHVEALIEELCSDGRPRPSDRQ